MGEIRFVGTGETRGYPYPVCKKEVSSTAKIEKNQSQRDQGLRGETIAIAKIADLIP